MNTLTGQLILHIYSGSDAVAARLAFQDDSSGHIIPLCRHDRVAIRDASGTLTFEGALNLNYSTHSTILNGQHVGQLFPWPEGCGHTGFAFVHGAPENIPADTWLWAVLQGHSVTLTLVPRALAQNEVAKGELLVSGVLEPYNNGCGTDWSVYNPRVRGFAGLNPLQDGDHLTIYETDGATVRWSGVVRFNDDERPNIPDMDAWISMFNDGLPALLRRKQKRTVKRRTKSS